MKPERNSENRPEPPSHREALRASVGLSVLFLVVYNATNWITSQRADVGTWYYEWERHIPFVPATILPYMSIDLFFVAAPFLCSDRRELKLFSRRIVTAILLAGVSFLVYPLTLAVERPQATGVMGAIFNWFRGVDLPYNLLPSLHITLRTILADTFARHTQGVTNWASHLWFSLIGFSTLLTYQHHVVDVAGGFLLALVIFYLVRETPLRMPVEPDFRIGRLYGLGLLLLIAVAAAFRPWSLLLLWPAASAGLVAMGYFGLGPGVFGKQQGVLPQSTRLMLGPLLLGQYLSLLYYRRQCRAWDAVTENVWIGRKLADQEAAQAIQQGVTAVIDLTVAFDEAKPFRDAPQVRYMHLPVLDLTAPDSNQLDRAVKLIEEQSKQGIVYVHCKIGYSRSAAVVGAWMLASGACKTADEALLHLKNVRPSIVIRPEAVQAIRNFERHGTGRK